MASISATVPPPDHRGYYTFSREAFVGDGYLHRAKHREAPKKGNMGGHQDGKMVFVIR